MVENNGGIVREFQTGDIVRFSKNYNRSSRYFEDRDNKREFRLTDGIVDSIFYIDWLYPFKGEFVDNPDESFPIHRDSLLQLRLVRRS